MSEGKDDNTIFGDKTDNLLKVVKIVHGYGNKALTQLLQKQIEDEYGPGSKLKKVLTVKEENLKQLFNISIDKNQWFDLYGTYDSRDHFKKLGEIGDLDVSLKCTLLLDDSGVWKKSIEKRHPDILKPIKCIKYWRNKIAHPKGAELEQKDFDEASTDLRKVIPKVSEVGTSCGDVDRISGKAIRKSFAEPISPADREKLLAVKDTWAVRDNEVLQALTEKHNKQMDAHRETHDRVECLEEKMDQLVQALAAKGFKINQDQSFELNETNQAVITRQEREDQKWMKENPEEIRYVYEENQQNQEGTKEDTIKAVKFYTERGEEWRMEIKKHPSHREIEDNAGTRFVNLDVSILVSKEGIVHIEGKDSGQWAAKYFEKIKAELPMPPSTCIDVTGEIEEAYSALEEEITDDCRKIQSLEMKLDSVKHDFERQKEELEASKEQITELETKIKELEETIQKLKMEALEEKKRLPDHRRKCISL